MSRRDRRAAKAMLRRGPSNHPLRVEADARGWGEADLLVVLGELRDRAESAARGPSVAARRAGERLEEYKRLSRIRSGVDVDALPLRGGIDRSQLLGSTIAAAQSTRKVRTNRSVGN